VELLAPAGDLEKLETAYAYGADAAYIGLSGFSLRRRADDVDPNDVAEQLRRIKGEKRLYGALNIYFHNDDIRRLEEQIDAIAALPLDAVIVSDIGTVPTLRKYLPDIELHLSTQANCLNTAAARLYQDIGFSRIIPAREMSLEALGEMKASLPDLEIEVFVHGAMCLAYSGRCLLSAWQAGRSGNKGECAHSCRWNYRVAIEEAKRPGQYFPVEEGDGFTSILSPKDLCMIDHLAALRDAGVDALKIEGRVKSVYYAAVVTRAYRKELDRVVANGPRSESQPFIDDLYNVSHREFSTGFFFSNPEEVVPTQQSYQQSYRLDVKNGFSRSDPIEFVGPDLARASDPSLRLFALDGTEVDHLTHQEGGAIEPSIPIASGFLLRRPAGAHDAAGAPDASDQQSVQPSDA